MIVKRRKSVFLTAKSKQIKNQKARRRTPMTPHFASKTATPVRRTYKKEILYVLGAIALLSALVAGGAAVAVAVQKKMVDTVGILFWSLLLLAALGIGAAVFFSIRRQKEDRRGTKGGSRSRYMREKDSFGGMREHAYHKSTRLRR